MLCECARSQVSIGVVNGRQDAVAVDWVIVWYMVIGVGWVSDNMEDRMTDGVTGKHAM